MAETSLTLHFEDHAGSGYDPEALRLEVEDYTAPPPTGFEEYAKKNGYRIDWTNYGEATAMYRSQCNGNGELVVYLRAFLSDVSMPYRLRTSRGTIAAGIKTTEPAMAMVKISNEQLVTVPDCDKITAVTVDGDIYDTMGNVLNGVHPETTGNMVDFGRKVVASITVQYITTYFRHKVTVPPRDVTEDVLASGSVSTGDLYAATVTAFYGSGVATADIRMDSSSDFSCHENMRKKDDPDDHKKYLVDFSAFDYCDGRDIDKNTLTITVDGHTITGTTALLEAGEHTLSVSSPGYVDTDTDQLDGNDTFVIIAEGG